MENQIIEVQIILGELYDNKYKTISWYLNYLDVHILLFLLVLAN